MGLTFLHTADIHIGKPSKFNHLAGKFGKEKRQDIWSVFNRITDLCEQQQIDLLLISGDMFHSEYTQPRDGKRVADKLSKLTHTRTVIIAGNHDYIYNGSLYEILDWNHNVTILREDKFHSAYFEDLNVEVYGLSWHQPHYDSIPDEFNQSLERKRKNILLLHGDINQSSSTYMPFRSDEFVYKGFDYIGLGHVHQHNSINKRMAYPGTPEPLDFKETGDHGVIVGEINGLELKTQFIQMQNRHYNVVEFPVEPEMTTDDIITRLLQYVENEEKPKDYFRIMFTGYVDALIRIEDIYETVKNHFYYIELNTDNLNRDLDIEGIASENQDNIIGRYIQVMLEKEETEITKKALYYGIEAFLNEEVKS
jgi:DNA repair exonuclease SbcCD nuclease subunit